MDVKDIQKLNLNSDIDIVIFPKKIIDTIHALGLKFKDELEDKFIQMYIRMGRADKKISEALKSRLKAFGINIETKIELFSIYKFEPEALNILTEYEMNVVREELDLNNHKNRKN